MNKEVSKVEGTNKITKRKVGRPKFQIDYEEVTKLASIMCTQEEIASILGCSVDTLQRDEKFCGLYLKAMQTGKSSLRRSQWKSAQDGNVVMQIWLGKNYLDQSDRKEVDNNYNLNLNVTAIDDIKNTFKYMRQMNKVELIEAVTDDESNDQSNEDEQEYWLMDMEYIYKDI